MRYNGTRTKSGHRSLFEQELHKDLKKKARKAKAKVEYETTSLEYTITRLYIPDFVVTTRPNNVIFIEAKGYFRPEDKVKMKFVKLCNPEADIRMVFPRRNKKDIKWCERHGFPYAIGLVPEEWLHEEQRGASYA